MVSQVLRLESPPRPTGTCVIFGKVSTGNLRSHPSPAQRFNCSFIRLFLQHPMRTRGTSTTEKNGTPGSSRNLGFINSGNVLLSHNL
jgi:hypothetical protein